MFMCLCRRLEKHKNHIVFTFHQLSFMIVIQLSYSDSRMPVKRYYYYLYESVLDFLRESALWLRERMKSSQVKLSFIVIPLHVWTYSGTRCRASQDHGAT